MRCLVADGYADWSIVDQELVLTLTEHGVRRTWELHSPGAAVAGVLDAIRRRWQSQPLPPAIRATA